MIINVFTAARLKPDVGGILLIEFIFPLYNQPFTHTLVDQLLGL
jgi:hypothetical protein